MCQVTKEHMILEVYSLYSKQTTPDIMYMKSEPSVCSEPDNG